jgi:hypothetical protein
MGMSCLYLLSQAAPSRGESVILYLLGVGGGTSLVLVVFLLLVRGFWSKYVTPQIQEEVVRWYDDPRQVEARARDRELSFKAWHDHQAQRAAREQEYLNFLRTPQVLAENELAGKKLIDNEIKRTDGLISKEIHTQVSDMETRLMSKLEEVSQFLREDTQSKQQMIQRMAKLEGAIHALLPYHSSQSTSNMPAQPKPR